MFKSNKSKIRLAFGLAIVAAVILFDLNIYDGAIKDWRFIVTNGIGGLALLLATFLIFIPNEKRDHKDINLFSRVVIGTAFLVLAVGYLSPRLAAYLSREDYIVENLSAGFLLLGSLILIWSATVQLRSRQWLMVALATFVAVVFFVMGMEEISWMQRIVGRETTGFMASYNQQGETNLHNLNATISNQLLAVGAFVLLTALPYYHKQVASWLDRRKYSGLQKFLPNPWLFLPFTVVVGFGFPSVHASVVILLIFFFTALMLLSRRHFAVLMLVTVAFISTSVNSGIYTDYINVYQEYREMFIALGCLAYAIGVHRKLAHSKGLEAAGWS